MTSIKLSDKERDCVLAALHYFHDNCADLHGSVYDEIATNGGLHDPPLNVEEMMALCGRLEGAK